jgi:hypothetical protein
MTDRVKSDHWAALASLLGAEVPLEEETPTEAAPTSVENEVEPAADESVHETAAPLADTVSEDTEEIAPPPDLPPFPPREAAAPRPRRPAPSWEQLAAELGVTPAPPPPPPRRREPEVVEPTVMADTLNEAAEGFSDLADELAGVVDGLGEALEAPGGSETAEASEAAEATEKKSGRRRRKRRRRGRDSAETRTEQGELGEQVVEEVEFGEAITEIEAGPPGVADEAVEEAGPEPNEPEPTEKRPRRRRKRRGGREGRAPAEARQTPEETARESEGPADLEGDEEFGEEHFDEEHDEEESDSKSVKIGFRNIPTWGEAVGTIVAKNMESRAKNPGNGGRGRGANRGRGGNRGGRRRSNDQRR